MTKNFTEHLSVQPFLDLSRRYLLEARVVVADVGGLCLRVCIDLPGFSLIGPAPVPVVARLPRRYGVNFS